MKKKKDEPKKKHKNTKISNNRQRFYGELIKRELLYSI